MVIYSAQLRPLMTTRTWFAREGSQTHRNPLRAGDTETHTGHKQSGATEEGAARGGSDEGRAEEALGHESGDVVQTL